MSVSARNKTLTLTDRRREELSQRLVTITEPTTVDNLIDRTVCGDLIEVLDLLPDSFADLIIVDPPYNLDKRFDAMQFSSMTSNDYCHYLSRWLPQLCRKLTPSGSIYVCCDWRCSSSIEHVLSGCVDILNRITWQREKGRGAKNNWKSAAEDIWFAVADRRNYCFNVEAVKMRRQVMAPYRESGAPKDWRQTETGKFRDTHPSNFWDDLTVPYWSMSENTPHPTQKPEKLAARLILASSQPGMIVFDPFGGSGTTAVTAKKLGRRYLSIEINREYCLWTEERLARAERNKTIQGYNDGVFWQRNTVAQQLKTEKQK